MILSISVSQENKYSLLGVPISSGGELLLREHNKILFCNWQGAVEFVRDMNVNNITSLRLLDPVDKGNPGVFLVSLNGYVFASAVYYEKDNEIVVEACSDTSSASRW
mgnify:CR=1 FL=1